MPEYKTLNVDPATYDLIVKLAEHHERSIGRQVRAMARMEIARLLTRRTLQSLEDTPVIHSNSLDSLKNAAKDFNLSDILMPSDEPSGMVYTQPEEAA